MNTASIDVPHLLSRRKRKHIGSRGVAEAIDLVLIAVASNLLVTAIGDSAASEVAVFPLLILYFAAMEAHTLGKRSGNAS